MGKIEKYPQKATLMFKIVAILNVIFQGYLFTRSYGFSWLSVAFEMGEGSVRAVLISYGVALLTLGIVFIVFVSIPKTRLAGFRTGWIGCLGFAFLALFLSVVVPDLFAFFQRDFLSLVPVVIVFLLLAILVFYCEREWVLRNVLAGRKDLSMHAHEEHLVNGENGTGKRPAIVFFSLGVVLAILTILSLLIYCYDKSYGGIEADDIVFEELLVYFWADGLGVMLLLGSYFYGHWKAMDPAEKWGKVFPISLMVIAVLGFALSIYENGHGERNRNYYSTYSREKWRSASGKERYTMLPDFERQVNLVGKDYSTVIYYLDSPTSAAKNAEGSTLDYFLFESGWVEVDEYYRITLSLDDIVLSTAYIRK